MGKNIPMHGKLPGITEQQVLYIARKINPPKQTAARMGFQKGHGMIAHMKKVPLESLNEPEEKKQVSTIPFVTPVLISGTDAIETPEPETFNGVVIDGPPVGEETETYIDESADEELVNRISAAMTHHKTLGEMLEMLFGQCVDTSEIYDDEFMLAFAKRILRKSNKDFIASIVQIIENLEGK